MRRRLIERLTRSPSAPNMGATSAGAPIALVRCYYRTVYGEHGSRCSKTIEIARS
jgi:hypothetical protein